MEINEMEPVIRRITKDEAKAASSLSVQEARYLVNSYYTIQEHRIAFGNQLFALRELDQPHETINYIMTQMQVLENQVKLALGKWINDQPTGQWAQSIPGIGPVLAAGLQAHIDIKKAPTAGHIWSFAGLINKPWEKGQKRPWNADLKLLCWKIGESFVKVSNRDNDFYGHVYKQRRELEDKRNDAGEFAEQAAEILRTKNYNKATDAYKAYAEGKLPKAHIYARSKRYAVKLFLAHWQHVAYEIEFQKAPPKPYIIEHGGHVDFIAPPNWPMK